MGSSSPDLQKPDLPHPGKGGTGKAALFPQQQSHLSRVTVLHFKMPFFFKWKANLFVGFSLEMHLEYVQSLISPSWGYTMQIQLSRQVNSTCPFSSLLEAP